MIVNSSSETDLILREYAYPFIHNMLGTLIYCCISLAQAEKDILGNGGKITQSLEEPKLTHVVLHKRDLSRRVELIRRTQK